MRSALIDLSDGYDPEERDPVLIAEAQRRFEVHAVIEQYDSWAVTDFGLECLTQHYPIAKSRLWEGEPSHGWLFHMVGRRGINLEDFAEGLGAARAYHRPTPPSWVLRRLTPVAPPKVKAEGARIGLSPSIRFEILKRDGYRCRLCGVTAVEGARLHVDHIVAVARGGSNATDNLEVLCETCNTGKGTKPL